MAAILIFKRTEGADVGDYSFRGRGALPPKPRPPPLSCFDTRVRWQPVTQSARPRRSYGKIEDCEQSTSPHTRDPRQYWILDSTSWNHTCQYSDKFMHGWLNFSLFCFVLYCYAFVQYCNVKTIQYNAMHKFVGVLDNPPFLNKAFFFKVKWF